eukprot:TRINITY_DN28266_c0_g1_i2.p1 TRINITY_DN28266_c0_g1~~TRINITY_DN28266_c0_g1_i2.p1  ORF type:complete len:165 (+),score=10.32 TRINITY_DN28266_c0_g1_i2:37-531(+)
MNYIPIRPSATTKVHFSRVSSLFLLLHSKVPNSHRVFVGEVGFTTGALPFVYGTDMAIYETQLYNSLPKFETFPQPPKILIDVICESNYTPHGKEHLQRKIESSFENGTEVAWLIHTGAGRIGQGVQVMSGKYEESAPLLVGDAPISDADLGLYLTASQLLGEE